MPLLPRDHPERLTLAEEVHARPAEPLDVPSRASYVALVIEPEQRERELAHLAALCTAHGVEAPAAGLTQFSAALGPLRLKWERHGEFSGYTFVVPGLSPRPFSEPAAGFLPPGWLAALPGTTVYAAHAKLASTSSRAEAPDAASLAEHFGSNLVVGSEIGDGAGLVFTDFRIHGDGFGRFLILDRGFTARQAGRMLQRLFEIESYHMMALLALPVARGQSPCIQAIEASLAALTGAIAAEGGDDEALQQQLTRMAVEIESGLAASQFRFGACRAYAELVRTRIAELREQRLPGLQTIGEFMSRRFTPAVATVASVEQRMQALSERVAQTGSLLSTRVEIARERQNQALLASMNRRARLQLRLQQTVEGLSVAAIVYYCAGLVGYLAKALKAGGVAINPDLAVGLSIPILLVLILLALKRARRRHDEADNDY
ncbi:DUF3422 family protein [Rivibacter subsaxonicus]|uniref:Putative membrane-anchored protein n=1 Tax=Rivibacter subsaxonicus TaxID=457575 RepID=A0A4Q7W0W6_9BURK|nr:DUF3422 domain-containing protein [Rivibacter subsaxonicus]RZU02841.1 putative membrane-anchored protein [Rivibacter subsaxonicus]